MPYCRALANREGLGELWEFQASDRKSRRHTLIDNRSLGKGFFRVCTLTGTGLRLLRDMCFTHTQATDEELERAHTAEHVRHISGPRKAHSWLIGDNFYSDLTPTAARYAAGCTVQVTVMPKAPNLPFAGQLLILSIVPQIVLPAWCCWNWAMRLIRQRISRLTDHQVAQRLPSGYAPSLNEFALQPFLCF